MTDSQLLAWLHEQPSTYVVAGFLIAFTVLLFALKKLVMSLLNQLLDIGSFQLPSFSGGKTLNGPVTHVRDGDTIEVNGTPIRFAKLDCPERGTLEGDRATREMRSLVSGERVSCRLTGRKSYDRFIGSCQLNDGRDLGREMIRGGYCGRW